MSQSLSPAFNKISIKFEPIKSTIVTLFALTALTIVTPFIYFFRNKWEEALQNSDEDLETVRAMLQKNPKLAKSFITMMNDEDFTMGFLRRPLNFAVMSGDHTLTDLLFFYNVKQHTNTRLYGPTDMMIAVDNNDITMLKRLIQQDRRPLNVVQKKSCIICSKGDTALSMAKERGYQDIIDLLNQEGAVKTIPKQRLPHPSL